MKIRGILAGGVLCLLGIRSVPAGHKGIVDLFGHVDGETLPSGLQIVNPFVRASKMSVQTREFKELMDSSFTSK